MMSHIIMHMVHCVYTYTQVGTFNLSSMNLSELRIWRERVEREVGGGIGMGKTCKSKAFSFQCMTKFTKNKKKEKKRK